METKLTEGLQGKTERKVKYEDTAANYGSGKLEVLATPALVAIMENTALQSAEKFLPPGYNTVGIEISIKHIKATPIGGKVSCKSVLKTIEGNKLIFNIREYDENGEIGKASHSRVIVDTKRCMKKLE